MASSNKRDRNSIRNGKGADKDVLEHVIGTQMALSVSKIMAIPVQYAFT